MARRQTDVEILDEVQLIYKHGGILSFQAVRYHHPNGSQEDGFRYCWRDANTGHLKTLRGQTRLPSLKAARLLMVMAEERPAFRNHRGWDADDIPSSVTL